MFSDKIVRRGNNFRRRKKCQVQQNYPCTIQGCQKCYGNQSSLRTHIRNKHSDSIKDIPRRQSLKRPGRPRKKNPIPLDPNNMWDDDDFIKFLEVALTIEPCDWIREDEDTLSEFNVHEFVGNLLEQRKELEIPYKLLRYMENGKLVFMDDKIRDLYSIIVEEVNKEKKDNVRWGRVIKRILNMKSK